MISNKSTLLLVTAAVAYIATAAFIVYHVSMVFYDKGEQATQNELRNKIMLIKATIESKLYKELHAIDRLANIVSSDPDKALENWGSVATNVLKKTFYVRNIALAPNDVVTRVFPLEANNKAIGLDYRTKPKQYAGVLAAKEDGFIHITEPVNLVQGGQGILVHFPIYLDYPDNNRYWGVLSIVLDHQRLLMDSNIAHLQDTFVLVSSPSQSELFSFGHAHLKASTPASVLEISIPHNSWQLQVYAKPAGAFNSMFYVAVVSGTIISTLVFVILLLLLINYMKARSAALHDPLTSLPNRRFLHEYSAQLDSTQVPPSYAVVCIDLDKFKEANDNYGHACGDAILKEVAWRIKNCIRSSDIAIRYGGDEFLILLTRVTRKSEIPDVVNKIEHAIEAEPLVWDGHNITIPTSIGFADSSEGSSVEATIHLADKRMYENKQR